MDVRGILVIPNVDGLLPHVEIGENEFEEIWKKLGVEFKSKFLTLPPVTPCYIVVVSNMKLDEIQQQRELPIRGYVDAKRTSRESWRECRQREDFAWTKVTGGIRCCPEFVQDQKRVNDKLDGLTVLAELGTRKFFDMHGTACAFTGSLSVPPRRTSESMIRL